MSVHMNLGSHNPDLSRNHKVIDELLDLVVSTEVSTERAAFTTSSAAMSRGSGHTVSNQSDREINSGDSNADSERDSLASPAPGVLSPEHPNDQEAREWREKFPFGADLADNACRNLEE